MNREEKKEGKSPKRTEEKNPLIKGVVSTRKGARYCTRIKLYRGEIAEVMICTDAIFNPDGVLVASSQHTGKKADFLTEWEQDGETDGGEELGGKFDNIERAKRRARKAVFDYAMCNDDLNLFVTLTLDAARVDRYDYKIIVKKLNNWLDNMVRRHGLKYVLVAERHKDGAIHFHALMNENACKLTDSGTVDKRGHTVFNLDNWTLGFTTAVRCYGERGAVCKYITKYITKSDDKVGGRWYYSGGELERPQYVYRGYTTPEDWADTCPGFEVYEKEIEAISRKFTILTKRY